jgi:hypothetical protein
VVPELPAGQAQEVLARLVHLLRRAPSVVDAVIHFLGVVAMGYWWFLVLLCKIEWWLLHCRPFIAAGCCFDLIWYTGIPQLNRLAWHWYRLPEPGEPC